MRNKVFLFGLIIILFINVVSAVQYANCAAAIAAGETSGYSGGCVPVTSCGVSFVANTYYLVTQDISANNGCFNIGVNNVKLNLNEYSITWGISPSSQTCNIVSTFGYVQGGIGCPSSVTGYVCHHGITISGSSVKVINGWLTQGGSLLDYSNAIQINGAVNPQISFLNISVYSNNSDVIHVGGGGARDVVFNNNYMISTATYLCDRHQGRFGITLFEVGLNAEIYNNTILNVPHTGIQARGATSTTGGYHIYNNIIRQNSRVTNGYAISNGGYGSTIHDNYINPFNGRGIGCSRPGLYVFNNFINVSDKPNSEYPAFVSHGIQFEDSASDILVYNNTVYSYSDPVAGGAVGINFNVAEDSNITVFNNSFNAFKRNNVGTNEVNFAAGVAFSGSDSVLTGDTGIKLYNNIFRSNQYAVFKGWDFARGTYFENNTFIRVAPYYATWNNADFMVAWQGPNGAGIKPRFINNYFVNNTYINHDFRNTMVDQGALNYSVRWFLDVVALDGASPIVDGTQVRVDSKLGNTYTKTTTNGRVHFVLPEYDYDFDEYGAGYQEREYSNYTVNVTYLGETQSQTVNLTSSRILTFNFNAGVCPDANLDGIVNVKDLAIVIFNQGRSATGNYAHLDFDESGGNINWNDVQRVVSRIGGSC